MRQQQHLLVLTYWGFKDALIQTYTLPYLRIIRDILPPGSTIRLLTLERSGASAEEVEIEPGIYNFSYPLYGFGIKAAFTWLSNLRNLKKIIRRKKITVIHTWCTSAGGIGWILSKRTGLPLILDSYEPHSEAMVETGTWKDGSIPHRILFYMERKQTFHAKWLIGVVPAMQDYAREKYGYTGTNFLFKPACVDLKKFAFERRKNKALLDELQLTDKITCVYVGKFGGLYLKEKAFEFYRKAFDHWGDRFRVLLLTSSDRAEIDSLCANAGIDPAKVISMYLQPDQVPDYLGLGDFAISAVKPVPSRRCCTPIKNGEYWAMGLPIIIGTGISEDSEIIASSKTGIVREDLTSEELARSVLQLEKILEENKDGSVSIRIRELAVKHRNYKIAEEVYRKIYG